MLQKNENNEKIIIGIMVPIALQVQSNILLVITESKENSLTKN